MKTFRLHVSQLVCTTYLQAQRTWTGAQCTSGCSSDLEILKELILQLRAHQRCSCELEILKDHNLELSALHMLYWSAYIGKTWTEPSAIVPLTSSWWAILFYLCIFVGVRAVKSPQCFPCSGKIDLNPLMPEDDHAILCRKVPKNFDQVIPGLTISLCNTICRATLMSWGKLPLTI